DSFARARAAYARSLHAALPIWAVIAGEGEERARLETLAATLGLSNRVQLTGRLDDESMLDHLARCRAVCFPPLQEDCGFVTVEADRKSTRLDSRHAKNSYAGLC